jgi:hypothetical protein
MEEEEQIKLLLMILGDYVNIEMDHGIGYKLLIKAKILKINPFVDTNILWYLMVV